MNARSGFAPVGAFIIALTGCGVLDEFETVIEDELVIPAQPVNQGPVIPSFSNGGQFAALDLSTVRSFQNNDVSPDDVDAIYIKSIELDMQSTGSQTFDDISKYIDSVALYVDAPGQDQATIAESNALPAALNANLDVTPDLNIKNYATQSTMSVGANVQLQMNRPPPPATISVTITLLVDINLFGS